MKFGFLTLAVVFFAGCDLKSEPTLEATPVPTPRPTTPKPGAWLMKDYQNALGNKPGAAPAPGATPAPGSGALKDYKSPLDRQTGPAARPH